MRRTPRPAAPPPMAKASGNGGKLTPVRPVLDVAAMRAAVTPQQISTEESKLLRVEESIRVFVRVADPKFRQVVPMRFFNLILTPAEADAFSADYLEEKSLRAQVARAVLRLVAIIARMTTEIEELKRAENSFSLWKLHADSLIALLEIERSVHENTGRVITSAKQQGVATDVETLQASQRKLNDCSALVLKTLTAKPTEKTAGAASAK